jgi:hypothetical protein
MTNTDLSILAEALAFALVITIGGAVLYAVARATLRRTGRQMLMAGLPVVALIAVALAGTAVWPFARQSVNEAVGVRLDDQGQPIASADGSGLDDRPTPGSTGSSGLARPALLFTVASIGTDGGVEPSAPAGRPPHDGAVDGGPDGGSDGGSGDGPGGGGSGGGGTDPSPTVEPSPTDEPSPTWEPSPTVEPSPTEEPSPTNDPSPTTEPSPTDDPPGPPWGSPGPPPRGATASSTRGVRR